MKRALALALAGLAASALAHSEPVAVRATLTPGGAQFDVTATLVGETSGLPVRGAALEARVTAPTGGEVGRVRLSWNAAGRYAGRLAPLAPGRYRLTFVDTTYRGEAAVASSAFTLADAPVRVEAVLPKTATPARYLTYALLGLLAPLLAVAVAAAWRWRRGRRTPARP